MPKHHVRFPKCAAVALALALLAPVPVRAMDTGDILMTDGWYGLLFAEALTGNIHRVGTSTPVADGLDGVVSDATGNVYALLAYAGVVYKISPASGVYTPVTSGGFLAYPNGIALLPGGDLLVSEGGLAGALVRVVPATGVQTRIYTGQISGVTTASDGVTHVILPDPNVSVGPACRLYRIDPTTGDTVRVSNNHIRCSANLETEANGNVIATQPEDDAVLRIYPGAGGAVQQLSSGGQLESPEGVAIEEDGTIVVTSVYGLPSCDPPGGETTCLGALIRINPVSGAQTFMGQESYFRLGGMNRYKGPDVVTPARRISWGEVKTIYR